MSNRQIQTITGVSRNSVANYVNSFNEMNLSLEKILVLNDDEIEQFFILKTFKFTNINNSSWYRLE